MNKKCVEKRFKKLDNDVFGLEVTESKGDTFEELYGIQLEHKWNNNLPQYHFSRDAFCKCVFDIFDTDDWLDALETNGPSYHTESFMVGYYNDEHYILHKDSGTLINFYKHTGRCNTCNKEDFSLDDFRAFLKLFKEELIDEDIIKNKSKKGNVII